MKENYEEFTDIDEFLEWYRSVRPETIYLVKNKKRYDEVVDAIRRICTFAIESNPKETVILAPYPDPLLGTSICFELVSNLVVFDDIAGLCDSLTKGKASCFEICTRTDGTTQIGFTFPGVFELAPLSK